MAVRDLAAILGDIIRKGQCPEIVVEYSCGHTHPAEVTVAPFLAEKREPRVAARALRVACRDDAVPFGESGSFTIKVPGGPYPGHEAGSDSGPGIRTALRCGAVSMDLTTACEEAANPIPVGIAAAQFATWVQTPLTEETEQRIQLTSCRGTLTWWQFFTTAGSIGPYLVGTIIWVIGCLVYAAYCAPRIPMLSPELFYQQVQAQIETIPVPKNSPHYGHYRKYYLQQYQQHLTQYRELEEQWRLNNGPMFHWGILLQGLGIGTWIIVVVLGICEYQYQTVTMWMEMLEDRWKAWRHRSEEADGGKKRKGGAKAAKEKKMLVKEEPSVKEKVPEKPQPPPEVPSAPRKKKRLSAPGKGDKEETQSQTEEQGRAATAAEGKAQGFSSFLGWFSWRRSSSEGSTEEVKPKEAEGGSDMPKPGEVPPTAEDTAVSVSKGPEEEPAVEPEPVAEEPADFEAEDAEEDEEAPAKEASQSLPEQSDEKADEEAPKGSAEGKDSQEAAAEEDDANENEWHVVTKVKEKKVAPPPNLPAPPPPPREQPSEQQELPKEAPPKEEEEIFQVPKNLETLSTQDLVAMLQRASLRRQLLRRGVPIREQLLRWFQELQEPPRKLRVAYGPSGQAASSSQAPPAQAAAEVPSAMAGEPQKPPEPARRKATPAPWSRLGNRKEEAEEEANKFPMRAEAPEFFPSDMTMMPAGTVLVPCVLPPAQDGTIAIPADHVLVVGAMGLPEGVPLIVPMSESFDSFQEINTQFEMSPITWPPMGLAENMNDVSIVDASSIGFLDVPAEDHVAAAIAAAAAAEAAAAEAAGS